jgi:hypothetical protein
MQRRLALPAAPGLASLRGALDSAIRGQRDSQPVPGVVKGSAGAGHHTWSAPIQARQRLGNRRGAMVLPAASNHVLHSILQLELTLLQCGLFDLLGLREVVLGGEFLEAPFKLLMLRGKLTVLVIVLEQQGFHDL